MELFELYSKEKAEKLFIKVSCAVELIKFVVSLEMDEGQQNG